MSETNLNKPDCQVIGEDGNIFFIMGRAQKVLRRIGKGSEAEEMVNRVYASDSYSKALGIIQEYVNFT